MGRLLQATLALLTLVGVCAALVPIAGAAESSLPGSVYRYDSPSAAITVALNPRTATPVTRAQSTGESRSSMSSIQLRRAAKGAEEAISMDQAVSIGADHVGGAGDMITTGKGTNYQFIHHGVDDQGRTVTTISRFDVNPSDPHVQTHGPHLNLEQHVDGVPTYNHHIPIDGSTVRPGDHP